MNLSIGEVKNLYYKRGLSAREAGEKLDVTAWQVIRFMRKHKLSRRSAATTRRLQFSRQSPSFKIKKKLTRKEEKLRVAGVMLYWAEGNKQKSTVDLANSDYRMIKIFLKFLREICQVDESRLRAFVYCYANQDIDDLENFWRRVTRIPKEQFSKPYIRKDFSDKKKGKMKHGLVHIRYADQKLVGQIDKWIKEFIKKA